MTGRVLSNLASTYFMHTHYIQNLHSFSVQHFDYDLKKIF